MLGSGESGKVVGGEGSGRISEEGIAKGSSEGGGPTGRLSKDPEGWGQGAGESLCETGEALAMQMAMASWQGFVYRSPN